MTVGFTVTNEVLPVGRNVKLHKGDIPAHVGPMANENPALGKHRLISHRLFHSSCHGNRSGLSSHLNDEKILSDRIKPQ